MITPPTKTAYSLREATRRYWFYLFGMAVFPAATLVGVTQLQLPTPAAGVLFVVLCGFTMWPVITKRAPYGFWLVALGAWTVGCLVAGVLAFLTAS